MSQNRDGHINTKMYVKRPLKGLSFSVFYNGLVKYKLVEGEKDLLSNAELVTGLQYRFEDTFILSAGIGTDAYSLGFSYDYNSSSLRQFTKERGTYEILLSLRK